MAKAMEDGEGEPQGPHLRSDLIGHEKAESAIRAAIDADRLHHAWLIGGPAGVGKATLAYRFARTLLTPPEARAEQGLGVSEAETTFRLVAAGSHPDLLTLKRPWDEKKKKFAADLPIAEVRKLGEFFSKTPSLGAWRVAIVDVADDLNRNSANALLKTLEEPPEKGVILVLAHAPGRVLPTIRSRCRRLQLDALTDAQTTAFVEREAGVGGEESAAIAAMAEGRPGFALQLLEAGGVKLLEDLELFVRGAMDERETVTLHGLAERLARPASEGTFRVFFDVLRHRIWLEARSAAGAPLDGEPARLSLDAPVDRLGLAWDKLGRLLASADAVNLDRKQVILNAAFILRDAIRG